MAISNAEIAKSLHKMAYLLEITDGATPFRAPVESPWRPRFLVVNRIVRLVAQAQTGDPAVSSTLNPQPTNLTFRIAVLPCFQAHPHI
jgi:hypothetical protein